MIQFICAAVVFVFAIGCLWDWLWEWSPWWLTTLSTSIMILALRAYADGVDELAHYARWVDSTMGRNLTVKDALKHGPG